ncbi:hypothetical protein I0Q91_09365 [Halanaerobiaceae bacterium Z-7014]|uniref:Uncharacterized protein n=1 Tax=Halonatronomonas betaini TaxID=2778430 RepID=A0A931ASW4_9FIRM|nr:hypothetical protein [Halonatronomonas betaini]MBF8437286.1 hypothetical protein [Halonatronomonas betaini]
MRTEPISKEQVKKLQKSLSASQKKISWNDIDYDVGRGVISRTKYCLWTEEGYRIEISVKSRQVTISQWDRKDPEYFKMTGKEMPEDLTK